VKGVNNEREKINSLTGSKLNGLAICVRDGTGNFNVGNDELIPLLPWKPRSLSMHHPMEEKMKSTRTKIMLVLLAALGLLLLSSCTANFITDLKSDGSGLFSQEYIMTEDELTSSGITLSENLCTEDMGLNLADMPPGTTVHEKQSGNEIRCIFESQFATLDELRTIYTDYMDSTVNDLRIEDGKAYYDVTVNMGEGNDTMGFLVYWIVNMPGSITDHNATEQKGNSLTWTLPLSGEFNVQATSNAGGISSTVWWIAGIAAFCLCLVVLVAVVVLIIVLVRRNRNKAEHPVSTTTTG
jgi:hypothetical protein